MMIICFHDDFFVDSFCDVDELPPSNAFFGNNIYTKKKQIQFQTD
jgi:hypothetical protein